MLLRAESVKELQSLMSAQQHADAKVLIVNTWLIRSFVYAVQDMSQFKVLQSLMMD